MLLVLDLLALMLLIITHTLRTGGLCQNALNNENLYRESHVLDVRC